MKDLESIKERTLDIEHEKFPTDEYNKVSRVIRIIKRKYENLFKRKDQIIINFAEKEAEIFVKLIEDIFDSKIIKITSVNCDTFSINIHIDCNDHNCGLQTQLEYPCASFCTVKGALVFLRKEFINSTDHINKISIFVNKKSI